MAEFNSQEHTVDEVLDFARRHPDRAQAFLDAEQAEDGKQRAGVINGLTAQLAPADDDAPETATPDGVPPQDTVGPPAGQPIYAHPVIMMGI